MEVFSRCGMRCDLCLIYRPNVEQEDRRMEICEVFSKVFEGFSPNPATIICDGCRDDRPEAVLFDPECKARACVIRRQPTHCGCCEDYPCGLFPAEPDEETLVREIETLGKYTWEDEALMKAYRCKKHMDAYREAQKKNIPTE